MSSVSPYVDMFGHSFTNEQALAATAGSEAVFVQSNHNHNQLQGQFALPQAFLGESEAQEEQSPLEGGYEQPPEEVAPAEEEEEALEAPGLPLGRGVPRSTPLISSVPEAQRMAMRPSRITSAVRIAPEERRGADAGVEQVARDLAERFNVQVERSSTRDGWLTLIITGKEENVSKARREALKNLQRQAEASVRMPKEYQRRLLRRLTPAPKVGPSAAKAAGANAGNNTRLAQIETATGTRIMLSPAAGPADRDDIHILGPREGVERARQELIAFLRIQETLAEVTITSVDRVYLPFIRGPFDENVKVWQRKYDHLRGPAHLLIRFPPPTTTDAHPRIFIAGDRDAVYDVRDQILRIHSDKKLHTKAISIEDIPHSQHKYLVGPRAHELNRILQETGVSVELPPVDEESNNTINLRGDPARLGTALTLVYTLMEQNQEAVVRVPREHVRYLIGREGATINRIRDETSTRINVPEPPEEGEEEATAGAIELVTIVGQREKVAEARARIEQILKQMENVKEIQVSIPHALHQQIIGRGGRQIRAIQAECNGIVIHFPPADSNKDKILLRGPIESVEKAKRQLLDLAKEKANMKEVQVTIPHSLHQQLIGRGGRLIRAIQAECNGVAIHFPPADSNKDKVIVHGPSQDCENAKKQLLELAKEKLENSYSEDIAVKREYHRFLIGRNGTRVKEMRDRLGVRILFPDLPPPPSQTQADSTSTTSKEKEKEEKEAETIQIVGKKENVQKARKEIEALIKDFESIGEQFLSMALKHQERFLANKAAALTELSEDFEELRIVFVKPGAKSSPTSGNTPDAQEPEANTAAPLSATLHIRGPKERVEACAKRVRDLLSQWDSEITLECEIGAALQQELLTQRNRPLVQNMVEKCKVRIKFSPPKPRTKKAPLPASSAAAAAAPAVEAAVATPAPEAGASSVEGAEPGTGAGDEQTGRASNGSEQAQATSPSAELPSEVPKEAPAATETAQVSPQAQASSEEDREANVVKITGQPADVQKAAEMLRALLPVIDRVRVEHDFQTQFTLRGAKLWRQIEFEHGVHLRLLAVHGPALPLFLQNVYQFRYDQNAEEPDANEYILIRGTVADIEAAKKSISIMIEELEKLRQEREKMRLDRVARSYRAVLTVPARFISSIIGRAGAKATELREKHQVQILFQKKSPPSAAASTAAPVAAATSTAATKPDEKTIEVHAEGEKAEGEDLSSAEKKHRRTTASEGEEAPEQQASSAQPAAAAEEQEDQMKTETSESQPVEPAKEEPAAAPAEAPPSQPAAESPAAEVPQSEPAAPTPAPVEENTEEVIIIGYKEQAEACRAEIETLLVDAAAQTTQQLHIHSDYHRRLIGTKGQQISDIRTRYNVQISFKSEENIIVVSGHRDKVKACSDEILKLVDEYSQELEFSLRKPGERRFGAYLQFGEDTASGNNASTSATSNGQSTGLEAQARGRAQGPRGAQGRRGGPRERAYADVEKEVVPTDSAHMDLEFPPVWATGSASNLSPAHSHQNTNGNSSGTRSYAHYANSAGSTHRTQRAPGAEGSRNKRENLKNANQQATPTQTLPSNPPPPATNLQSKPDSQGSDDFLVATGEYRPGQKPAAAQNGVLREANMVPNGAAGSTWGQLLNPRSGTTSNW